ncbi:putative meiotically up-regulated gene 72 protein [Peziza echinospora]|nr:putative meiotically up-regulated gene 72 protein [Peziza echinospora]
MAPSASPRLRVLSVGGNAVSAFLSWRLQATNACDVTLVWKTGFDAVSQYGISFKSKQLGNERFKPRSVVRTPEDAAACAGGFDYVLLCVKALPDVYDLAAVIESVVTPEHTCILVNTTNSLGIEPYLHTRYPSNVILSLVSGASINQLGASEFEHLGNSDIWVGSTIKNSEISTSIQMDMAEALALTLVSGNVQCHVSTNIRQQQWERMIGPIAFYPLTVMLDSPNHSAMLEKPGIRKLVNDLIDELIAIAVAEECKFPPDFKTKTLEAMVQMTNMTNTMYMDYTARRPIEIEVHLGSPIKIAQLVGVKAPHCETLYGVLHHMNQMNLTRGPNSSPPSTATPPPRQMPPRGQMSMRGRPPPPNGQAPPGGPMGRRNPQITMNGGPPPPPNGYPPRMNGAYSPKPGSNGISRRNSFDGEFEEFGHLAMYPDMVDGGDGDFLPDGGVDGASMNGGAYGRNRSASNSEFAIRQREMMEFREQEMRRNGGGRGGGPGHQGHPGMGVRRHSRVYHEDDDDEEGYFDNGPVPPPIDPDSIDMMSVTSRRNRRVPSNGNLRNMEPGSVPNGGRAPRHSMGTPRPMMKNRTSARLVSDISTVHDNILENPLLGYSSNRYGTVDRKMLSESSRANSLSASRMGDPRDDGSFTNGNRGPYPPPGPRPNGNTNMRPNGPPINGNGYPPQDFRPRGPQGPPPPPGRPQYQPQQPLQRYPSAPGEPSIPNAIDHNNYDPVSQPHNLVKGPSSNKTRSTTGSASASAASSGSGRLESDRSAHSSSSSIERKSGFLRT